MLAPELRPEEDSPAFRAALEQLPERLAASAEPQQRGLALAALSMILKGLREFHQPRLDDRLRAYMQHVVCDIERDRSGAVRRVALKPSWP
jgi:hypothetical protein